MRAIVIGVVLLVLVAAGIVVVAVQQNTDSEAGLGIPTEDLLDAPFDDVAPQTGTLHVAANGCFHLDTDDGLQYLVWPRGSRQDADVVHGPDGTEFAEGDHIDGDGWVRPADEVIDAGDGPDGYMGAIIGFCVEDDEQVVVLQSIR